MSITFKATDVNARYRNSALILGTNAAQRVEGTEGDFCTCVTKGSHQQTQALKQIGRDLA